METTSRKIARFDFTPVYTHPQAKVDIILIHGLNGHPEKTWTSRSTNVYWPTDLLPQTLKEKGLYANILVYGYNADVFANKDKHPSQNFLHQHGQTMINYLATLRRDEKSLRNPIIWIVHSLGGLVLKSALLYSDSVREPTTEHLRSIYVSTFAIAFLGTPHEGSGVANWGTMLHGMIGHVGIGTEPVLIRTLRKDNETLDNLNTHFLNIMQKFEVALVYEAHKTSMLLIAKVVVPRKSAAPNWGGKTQTFSIEANHSDMCKFDSFDGDGYRQLTSIIANWIKKSQAAILGRWEGEDANRRRQAQESMNELARSLESTSLDGTFSPSAPLSPFGVVRSTPRLGFVLEEVQDDEQNETTLTARPRRTPPPSPLPNLQFMDRPLLTFPSASSQRSKDAIFYHPETFRPNSYFVGRGEQLQELHRMLQDSKRRKDGTSAVLVRGRTGGGKTHMVRQYVYEYRHRYSGGVFWLQAHSIGQLEGEFLRIWQMVNTGREDARNHTELTDAVRSWFNSRSKWLIVLDGIMFDQGVERFVPDAADTSVIFTSTSPSVTGNHHFDNPQMLELPPLSVQEAQKLLLEEMEQKLPWSQEDLKQAAELVRLVDKLPLMIHVVAQQLKETREPLSAFLKRYRKKPHIHRKIEPFELVLDRLDDRGANAALNVLRILAFFDQHTPVEMLALGLRALELPFKTGEAGTHERPTLNNTLKVLIALALIERSDSYDLSPTSSLTSKRSVELFAQSMDTLKMYSVMQRYLVEWMSTEGTAKGTVHIFWLQNTVDVFCRSLLEADARIKDSPRVGIPDDYRRFQLHGKKILGHITQYDHAVAELTSYRKEMEASLLYIEERHKALQERTKNTSFTKSGEPQYYSVFDRANSLSESECGTLSSQSHSQEVSTPLLEDYQGPHMSPVQYEPLINDLPYPVFDEEVVADSSGFTLKPSRYNNTRSLSQGMASLRSPAEVSISHEMATPFIHPAARSSSKDRISGSSEAELALIEIRQNSPRSPPRGGGVVRSKGRSASSGARIRPTDLVRPSEHNYAPLSPAGLTPNDERHNAEFSLGAAASDRTSLVGRIKENIPFIGRRKSSSSSASRPSFAAPTSVQSSPGVGQTATIPTLPVLPDRSARSSPGQGISPFSLPRHVGQTLSSSGVRHPQPPGLHQNFTEPYQPSLRRVESSSLDPMAMSFPLPEQTPRRQITGGAYYSSGSVISPGGPISATPMSRDSSRRISNPSRVNSRRSGEYGRGAAMPPSSGDRSHYAASPLSSPVNSEVSASRFSSVAVDGQGVRPPSMIIEPSPLVDLRYPDITGPPDLSLRPRRGSNSSSMFAGVGGAAIAMSDHYVHAKNGPTSSGIAAVNGGSLPVTASSFHLRSRRGSVTSDVMMPPMPPTPAPVSRQNRYSRTINAIRRGSGRGRGRGRAHSESPSTQFRLQACGSQSQHGSPEPASEPMSRGGSGGIVVGDGHERQLVPFGDATAESLNVASRRLRQQHIDRQPPPQIPPRRSSASSSRGSHQGQMSPPTMSRGNSGGAGAGLGINFGDDMDEAK